MIRFEKVAPPKGYQALAEIRAITEEDKTAFSDWTLLQIDHSPSNRSTTNLACVRSVSKCALAVIAIARSASFVPITMELPCGELFAAANLIGNTALQCWIGSRCINIFLPDKIGEGEIFQPRQVTTAEITSTVAIVFFSLFAQLPFVYPAMEYNEGPYSIPIGVIVMLGGAFLPLCSMKLIIDKKFQDIAAQEKKISPSIQKSFVKEVQRNRQAFMQLSPLQRAPFLEALESIKAEKDSNLKVERFWCLLLSLSNTQEGGDQVEEKLLPSSYILGCSVLFLYQAITGVYTFIKTKENVFDNDVFAGFMATGVVLTTVYLTGRVMIQSIDKLCRSIIECGSNDKIETVVQQFHKRSISVLYAFGMGINFLSLGLSYVVWRDFFKDKTEKMVAEAFMCFGVFLLLSASTPSLINSSVEATNLYCCGSKEEKDALNTYLLYKGLEKSLGRVSPENFLLLSSLFPRGIRNRAPV